MDCTTSNRGKNKEQNRVDKVFISTVVVCLLDMKSTVLVSLPEFCGLKTRLLPHIIGNISIQTKKKVSII